MVFSNIVTVLVILPLTYSGSLGEDFEPEFLGSVHNVTVVVGREAVLSCSVTKLKDFKVGWIKAGDQTILSLHKRVITHNDRIHITHDEHNTWNLHIKDVRVEDQDCYMCQINTEKMKKQVGCVTVLVPPDIDQELSSGDVTVTEGGNTTLTCITHGQPQPTVTWIREDKESIKMVSSAGFVKGVEEWRGTNLQLFNVKREHMGAFMCIARNNVPPAVSRRIVLNVHFQPKVWVHNQLVGAPLGHDVTIECVIEAYPKSITYWQKIEDGKEKIILNGPGHRVLEDHVGYRTSSRLRLRKFSSEDAGTYQCVSSNSLGKDQQVIRIYENPQVTESLWRDDDEDPRTEVRVTTPPTIVKIITAAPEYRNTYKYVDYTRGKTNKKYRGHVSTERNADVRNFFSGSSALAWGTRYLIPATATVITLVVV